MKRGVFLFIALFLCGFFSLGACASEIEEREQAIKEALFVASAARPQVLKIGLVDCITYALKNNSAIKIKRIEPLIAKEDIKKEESAFDPTLSFTGSLDDSKTETPSIIAGSHTRTGQFDFGLEGKLPLGTEYELDFLNTKSKSNSAFLTTNPYYETEYALTITQPLFKDFGLRVNRADIVIAKNKLEKSDQNLKEELIAVISKVKQAYNDYVLHIEKHKTAQLSLKRAEDLLNIIQERYNNGLVSSIDLLEAKTAVAEREDALLSAERALKLSEDSLKYETNLVAELELWHAHIEPLDKPKVEDVSVDLVESLKEAFVNRPDYAASKIDLKNQNIRIMVEKNSLLPTVDLTGSLALNGLDKDYQDAQKADYKKWSTGIKFSYPWANRKQKADYEQANLTKRQLLISFERLQQQIILEVRDAVREMGTAQKRIAAAQKRLQTQEARYKAIEERFREGLVSAHDILEYQEDLSLAETNYIQALIDYSQSLINLDKVTGTTLVKNDIKLEE